jgi:alpha-glucosidase
MIQFHRDIIRLRKENQELRYGSLKYVDSFYNFIAYGRFKRNSQCLIIVNNNDCPVERQMFVWDLGTAKDGKMRTIFQTDENGYRMEGTEYEVVGGKIRVNLPKTSAVILKYFPE